ncbi:DUF4142 domain-containing protein [Nitrosovibrio tenuis]|uniref:Putative membrane protein n=1 Tax=Nitrosovibrio tenuis TaxID=1233 RepID=A0A1H7ILV4_9PROT|nr:DUF4142 domain-containing protein [Nitrosovibrio tenuis]SEK63501.1 putative membrane protein [Nitrosovibrio tenuis]
MKNLLILIFAVIVPAFATGAHAADKKGPLSDAQIVAALIAANEVAIDAAKLAESKTMNDQVKAYAQRMVREHTDLNKQTKDLAGKLDVKPEESKISKSMKSDGQRVHDRLQKLSGRKFDKAYLYDELAFHKQVLQVVDNQLMPSASSRELQDLLAKIRPALASHLEYADQTHTYVDQMRY